MYEVEDFIECQRCDALLAPGDLATERRDMGEICARCAGELDRLAAA
jgi:hypothetical protein